MRHNRRIRGTVTILLLAVMLLMTACTSRVKINAEIDSLYSSAIREEESPEWVRALPSAQDPEVTQLFVVGAMGMDRTTASVSMHERDESGDWKQILSTPGYVGKNGLCPDAEHAEGCGQTPAGVYHFNKAFGIAPDPGCAIPYTRVDDNTYWSGDDRPGMHYNEMVDLRSFPDLDMANSEHIIDYSYEYQYCLNISFNEDGTPGRGSAIFLHCLGAKKPYTGGCVAIPENIMKLVMQQVREDCVVVIDTLDNMGGGFGAPAAVSTEPAGSDPASADAEIPGTETEASYRHSDDSSDFVLLSEAVPDAILEIRYYSTYNFVGERIDGYEEPLAFLTKEAAAALRKVSDELVEKGYRLKIFDAYRPQKAVTHFANWALDTDDTRMKEYFYPELDKDVLFPLGYIDYHSGHIRGSTVDLTLFDMRTEKEVDMGGTFDYFGELSHPDYRGITAEQYENRMILREAMMRHGFKPLPEEWWHFTLINEPYPDTYFTFPVNSEAVTSGNTDKAEQLQLLNRAALQNMNIAEGPIYVIGHMSPDSDTVCSAISYARLLKMLGYDARPAVTGSVNRETAYILKEAGVDTPPILPDASGENIFLVDHSEYLQAAEGMRDANIVGILDHHGVGSVTTGAQVVYEARPIGAAATIVWLDYLNYGFEPDPETAFLLLGAILSDTRNLTGSTVTDADRAAVKALAEAAGVSDVGALYDALSEELLSYAGMSSEEILFSDYKEYEAGGLKFGIGIVNATDEENAAALAEQMKEVLPIGFAKRDVDLMYASVGIRDGDMKIDRIVPADGRSAQMICDAFPDYDEYDGTSYIFRKGLGRKTKFVPGLTDFLEARPHE